MPLYPTIYNIETGEWEEVNPAESQAEFGIPIGPPRQYSTDIHEPPSGGLEMPGNEPPPYYNPGMQEQQASIGNKPQMFASTGQGVPSGYRYPTQTDDEDDLEDDEREEEQHRAEVDRDQDQGVVPDRGATPYASGVQGMVLDNPPEAPAPQTSYNGNFYPSIAQQRAKLVSEIDNNPKLREFAAAAISQEAGHPDGILATVETLFNRTQQRGTSISRELTNGFYGPVNKGYVDNILRNGVQPWMYKQFDDAMDAVRNGSDLSEGRTDQGGIDEIKGPKTKIGDEYFGYMDGDPTWSIQHQRNKGDPSGYSGRRSGTSVPGMELDQPQASGVPGMVLDKQQGAPSGGQPSRLTGLDGAIADAKEAGLTVTSGYRGPDDPLTRANPRSPHAQGRAFDLRAQTGQEADAVIAKQRQIFTQRGLKEGRDYTFLDEVRSPSGHATGPHVHVQLTESGLSNYQGRTQLIPLEERKPKRASGVPGMVLDEQPEAKSYDTKLTGDEEKKYQTWKAKYAPNDSGADYDLRGAYKAGLTPDPKTGHWPDTYKKPNHPTFSNQSKYATGEDAAKAGHWEGNQFVPPSTQAPVRPEVPSQQLPSGEMAPTVSGGQEAAASANILGREEVIRRAEPAVLPRLSPSVARTLGLDKWIDQDTGREVRRAELAKFEPAPQIVHQKNRDKLQGAIEDLEKEGYTVPHTIGKPNEPEGDRAPTIDMETLRDTLKRKADYEARTGRFDKSKETRKQQEFWDNKIKTEGMSAEQAAMAEEGEPSLGINTRLAGEMGLWPIDLTPDQERVQKKVDALNKERTKLVQTFTPDQTDKAQEIQKLDDQISAANKEFASLTKQREKALSPEQLRERDKKRRRDAFKYGVSVEAAGLQELEQSILHLPKGVAEMDANATRKLVNPYPDAAVAKAALPHLESQLAIFKEGVANETAKLDPSDEAQAKRLEAYNQQVTDLQRKVDFAKARIEGKSGEGLGAQRHRLAAERVKELEEKTMPEVRKKWDSVIDQANKDDVVHRISRSIHGSLPSSVLMAGTAPISMPASAVAGFAAIFLDTYSRKGDEYDESMKKQGKKGDPNERARFQFISAASTTPMEELGDMVGSKIFLRALAYLPNIKPAEQGKWLAKTLAMAKETGKEVGPTLVAEGLVTNPIQSIIEDVINEKYGIQDPTTAGQKLIKAGYAGAEGAASALLMWGIPSATIRGAKYFSSLPTPAAAVSAGAATPVVPAVVPAGTLTGAAAQMGATGPAADIPYTPPGVAPLPTTAPEERMAPTGTERAEAKGELAKAGPTPEERFGPTPAAPAAVPTGPAPVEPTVETEEKPSRYVRDKDGKRGEVISEKEGEYEVEWDDDTKGTVKKEDVTRRKSTKITVKNSIQLAPQGKSVAVVRFDGEGNMQREGVYDSVEEAEARAKRVAAEHNYAGYEDENSKFVRTAGQPETTKPEVTVTKAAEPAAPPAAAPGVVTPPATTGEWQGPEAQPGEPGLSPEQQEAFLKAGAKKAQSAASHPNHVEVNNVSPDGAYMMDPHGNIFSVRDTSSGRSEDYGTHDNYSLTNLGYPLRDAMKEGWIRVVTDRVFKQVHWDGRNANNAQLRALKDMGAVTGHEVRREGQEFSLARTNKALAKIEKATGLKGLIQKVGAAITGKKTATEIYAEESNKYKGMTEAETEAYFRDSGMHKQMTDTLNLMGVPVRYVSSANNRGAPAAVNPYEDQEDADLTLDISGRDLIPMIETTRRVGGDKAAQKLFNAILTEEVMHAADNRAADEEYNALSPKEKGMAQTRGLLNGGQNGRLQFKQERYTAIVKEAKRIAQAATAKDARAIAQLFIGAVNTYKVGYEAETEAEARDQRRPGYFGKPEGIFDYLMDPSNNLINVRGWQIIPELLRQAKQFQLTGQITEQTHAHLYDKLGKLFKNILNGMKRSLRALTGTGKLPAIDKILADMDAVLAGDPVVNRQSSVQSIPYGSQAFNDFVGTTTITIGPNGEHQALYAVGPPDFANGLGFRFNPEQTARRAADANIAQGNKAGYALMPVWVRAEQPAMIDISDILRDQKRGGWTNPENVAAALVKAGHLTQEDLGKIKGPLTNAAINQALRDKGFDSIAFRQGDRAPTVIVLDNTQVASATGNSGVYHIDNLVKTKDPNANAFETEIVNLHNTHGGSSYNAVFGDMGGTDFYAVGSFPELSISIKGKEITRQDIIDIRDRAMAQGIDLNTKHIVIGTWFNEETGWTDIDISAMVGDLHTAYEIAEQHQQTAIFDLSTFGTLYTNGAFPVLGGLPSLSERNGFIAAKAAQPIVFIKTEDELTVIAKENEQYKNWYDRFAKYMRDNFLKDYPEYIPLINYFLASTSPAQLVAGNFTRMVRALKNFVETGDPGIDMDSMEAHQYNLRRSVKLDPRTGKPVDEFENLSGLKVTEYTPALFGDPTAMAIDRHVAMILFGTKEPTDAQREEAMRMIMRIAKRLNWTYAEVQAAFFAADLVAAHTDPETGKVTPGKKVDHYERTAELRRAEVYKWLDEDRKRGGLGAKISASLLERTRKRTGVERLLGTDTRAKQQILRAREVAINEYVASAISLRGPPRKAGAKGGPITGAPTTGTPTTDHDNNIPHWTMSGWFYNGIKHVFWNSPGLTGLGDMIHKHVDLRRKLAGEHLYPIARWMGSFVQARPAQKKAINEHQAWRQKKGAGSPTPSLSPRAKELKNLIDGTMANVNKRNASSGVKIRNPAGVYVPMPSIEYPHIIQQKYMDAMRHPNKHKSEWNEIVDNLKKEGIIPKGASEYEARVHVQNFLRKYDKNGALGSYFFHNKMLPSMVHDYSLGGFQQFMQAWIDKTALAESFGSNPSSDLFEFAKEHTTHKEAKDYIGRAKALAYGDTVNDLFGRASSFVGGWASIQHLANWVTAVKDLISGQIFNMAILGPRNYVTGFWSAVVNPYRAINDPSEQGIILSDITKIMTDGEMIGGVRESVGKAAMSVSFRNFVETWNRGIAYQGGKSMLRHAIYAYQKNPRSPKVLSYMAAMEKLGFRGGRAELLLQEGGKGELAGEYLRSLVNAIQAGYTYADVPAFASEPAGKFWLKYAPWSLEHTRLFFTSVLGADARNVGLLKKDKITVIDPATGKKSEVEVPRRPLTAAKLAWYLFLTTAGGAGEEWLLEKMFRMRSKTARWSEILDRFRKDDPRKYNELALKLFQVNMIVGTFGALGNYIQSGLMAAGVLEGGGRGGLENLSKSMPALDPALKLYDMMAQMWEQKAITGRSLEQLANAVSGYRVAAQTASNVANDVFGADYWYSKLVSNRQDLSRLKTIQNRWMEDIGKAKAPEMLGMTRMEKTEEAQWRDELHDMLSIGDVERAKKILADVKAGMTQQRWAIESEELKRSIKTKQPVKGSEVAQSEFWRWAKATLPPEDIELVRRLNDTYRKAATQINLGIEFKPPSDKDIIEFRQKIKIKQQPTTYPWSPFKF